MALWMLLVAAAWARPVSWAELPAAAAAAWAAGPGAAAAAAAEGREAAAARAPVGPRALWVQAQQGLPGQDMVTVAADLPLRTGAALRAAGRADAAALRAADGAAALDWTEAVQAEWLAAWRAREIAHHLSDYAAEVRGWLAPVEAAAAAGLAAPLDVADLRAEFSRVTMELAAAEAEARAAEARLSALLGEAAEVAGADEALHAGAVDLPNPWAGLEAAVAGAPAVRAAAAAEAAAEAVGRASRGAWAPVLSVGGVATDTPTGDGVAPMAFVGLELPLAQGQRAAAARAAGDAAAAAAAGRHAARRLSATVAAEAAAFEAGRAQLQRLEAEVMAPLLAREQALEAAFAARQVPAERLVRARRDRHEAEHEEILVVAALRASEARAAALRAALGGAR